MRVEPSGVAQLVLNLAWYARIITYNVLFPVPVPSAWIIPQPQVLLLAGYVASFRSQLKSHLLQEALSECFIKSRSGFLFFDLATPLFSSQHSSQFVVTHFFILLYRCDLHGDRVRICFNHQCIPRVWCAAWHLTHMLVCI